MNFLTMRRCVSRRKGFLYTLSIAFCTKNSNEHFLFIVYIFHSQKKNRTHMRTVSPFFTVCIQFLLRCHAQNSAHNQFSRCIYNSAVGVIAPYKPYCKLPNFIHNTTHNILPQRHIHVNFTHTHFSFFSKNYLYFPENMLQYHSGR